MVKSTVRFPESVVDDIESLVADEHFESKSEFYRFSADHVLDPEPEREIGADADADHPPFFESVSFIRKLALRGNVSDAEDFIDHQYTPSDHHAILLEEILRLYRSDTSPTDGRSSPERERAPQPPAADPPAPDSRN